VSLANHACGCRGLTPQLTVYGHYEILAFISKGGMGKIYHARDTKLDSRLICPHLIPS